MVEKYDKCHWPGRSVEKKICFSRRKFSDLADLLKTTIESNPNTLNFRSLSVAKKLTSY